MELVQKQLNKSKCDLVFIFKIVKNKAVPMVNYFIILFSIFWSCARVSELNFKLKSENLNSRVVQPKILKFHVDNNDSTKFGFLNILYDSIYEFEFSITSICIENDFVYLTDEVHKNIKRINLVNSEVSSSRRLLLSEKCKLLDDITVFNQKVYVSTFSDSVFVLDRYLNLNDVIHLPTNGNDPVYFHTKTDSTLSFYIEFTDSIYTINKSNRVIESTLIPPSEKYRWINKFNLDKGIIKDKELLYTKTDSIEYIKIRDKTIKLVEPFKYCSEAFNLTYSDKYLVIFYVDSEELVLYAYNLE